MLKHTDEEQLHSGYVLVGCHQPVVRVGPIVDTDEESKLLAHDMGSVGGDKG